MESYLDIARRVIKEQQQSAELALEMPCPEPEGVPRHESVLKGQGIKVLGSSGSAMPCPTNSEDEPVGVPWAEWKAAELNRLFQQQGLTGELGRITPATVRDGERKERVVHNTGKDTQ